MSSVYKVPLGAGAETMAYQASADSSSKAGFLFKENSGKATLATAATDVPKGVLVEAASDSTSAALTLCVAGKVKAQAGGTIGEGDKITTDASGNAIATTTLGNYIWGHALEDAADGDTFWMLVAFGQYGTYA